MVRLQQLVALLFMVVVVVLQVQMVLLVGWLQLQLEEALAVYMVVEVVEGVEGL
jgi:hypothetical protein